MISVSILGIKDDNNKLQVIDNLKPNYLHLDIMDGLFVSNNIEMTNLPLLNTPKDIHLMVNDVKKYVDIYKKYNPNYITFHVEVQDNVSDLIDYIHSLNIKVGLSIKPNTPVSSLKDYLKVIDMILVMSVEPGYGGQEFMDSAIAKVNELAQLRQENNYKYLIEIDGGINNITKKLVPNCDIFVVGSYITASDDYKEALNSLK